MGAKDDAADDRIEKPALGGVGLVIIEIADRSGANQPKGRIADVRFADIHLF